MTNKESLDWESIQRELDWDNDLHHQQVMQARLKQRAEQYATPLKTGDDDLNDAHTVLTFNLGGEKYGVDVMLVLAIRELTAIAQVPGVPPFYKGVVNVRGKITTVMDLRAFFDIHVNDLEPPNELIIVRANKVEIGLLAHHVEGVMTIPRSKVESMTEIKYTKGITADKLILLDIASLFEDERLIVGGVDE